MNEFLVNLKNILWLIHSMFVKEIKQAPILYWPLYIVAYPLHLIFWLGFYYLR